MQVDIELFATLRERLKARFPGGRGTAELVDGSTLEDLGRQLEIPMFASCAILVNGQVERDRLRPLPAGSKITLIPPVAGG